MSSKPCAIDSLMRSATGTEISWIETQRQIPVGHFSVPNLQLKTCVSRKLGLDECVIYIFPQIIILSKAVRSKMKLPDTVREVVVNSRDNELITQSVVPTAYATELKSRLVAIEERPKFAESGPGRL